MIITLNYYSGKSDVRVGVFQSDALCVVVFRRNWGGERAINITVANARFKLGALLIRSMCRSKKAHVAIEQREKSG